MSPTLQVNFADAVEDVVPAGTYPCIIEKVEIRQKEGEGTVPYFNWDFKISEGEYEGRHVFMTTSLKANSLWKLLPVLQALGVIPDDGDQVKAQPLQNFEFDESTNYVINPPLAGMPCIVKGAIGGAPKRFEPSEIYNIAAYPSIFGAAPGTVQLKPQAPSAPAPAPAQPAGSPPKITFKQP